MKRCLLPLLYICLAQTLWSQAPLVKMWDKRFGGTEDDELRSFQQPTDGGYILGGSSESGVGGDKTQSSYAVYDYWVVKIDSFGNKQWDKSFGGTDNDHLSSLIQTIDQGYILGNWSYSGISGDKTQVSWGSSDYWIIKIDSLGNKEWDKDFGGTSTEEYFENINQTPDGGYLLSGMSYSTAGGDKSEKNLGISKYGL